MFTLSIGHTSAYTAGVCPQRQSLTDHGNQQENTKQIDYDYKVGDKVLVINKARLASLGSLRSARFARLAKRQDTTINPESAEAVGGML